MFFNRLFNAGGSWSSVYFATFFSYALLLRASMVGGRSTAFLTMGMLPSLAVGALGGVYLFGEPREFRHLLRNYATYRQEFKMIKNELYYSWINSNIKSLMNVLI